MIGGIAAVLHGSPQNTFDLDICFATDRANVEALGDVLVGLGASLRGIEEDIPFVADADTLARVQLLTLETPFGGLDVMTRPGGSPGYETLRRRSARFDLGGVAVRVASLEDLIAMKRAGGRPKDLSAVADLEAIRRRR